MTLVLNKQGESVDVNWGEVDLSGIPLDAYPDIDLNDQCTIGEFTGPRYVRYGNDGIADLALRRPVPRRSEPHAGYCPFQAEVDHHREVIMELIAQRDTDT